MARGGRPPRIERNEGGTGETRHLLVSRYTPHTSRFPFHASQTQERGWRQFSTLLNRTMLPSRSLIVWWVLAMIMWATTVGSVQETPEVGTTDSFENQAVENGLNEEAPSAETTLLEQLQARLKEVEERERGLQLREERLTALQQDLEALAARQTKEGKRLVGEASSLAEEQRRYVEQDPALIHLIKIYESMDPEEAALRIAEMREGLALDILAAIKDKKAAGVLAGVEPVKAARLSEGLRRYRDIKLQQRTDVKPRK
jgi:flagellar motility protein MotE (MotC chaperone)